MSEYKLTASVKQLIDNNDFVLWCLTPTDDSDAFWCSWCENDPQKIHDLNQARRIIRSAEINKQKLTAEESDALYGRLMENMKSTNRLKKQKKQKVLYGLTGIAACIAVVCVMSVWRMSRHTEIIVPEILAVGEIQETPGEVVLEISGSEKVVVDNKSTIQIDKQGTIQITGKQSETLELKTSSETNQIQQDKEEVKMNTLRVPKGRHSSLILADGTKVWVNSGSVLRFPSGFEEDNRTIFVDGEIYLEVEKDTSRPFCVKTSAMDVQVLGTSFNVTAYGEDRAQSVVLVSGSVEVSGKDTRKCKITPNERVVIESGEMKVARVNVYDYISWKDGVLRFNKQKMGDITQRLSRYYGLEFVCPAVVSDYVCSGKLVLFDDVTLVMKTLSESFPISCTMENDKIILSTNPEKK